MRRPDLVFGTVTGWQVTVADFGTQCDVGRIGATAPQQVGAAGPGEVGPQTLLTSVVAPYRGERAESIRRSAQ